MKNLFSIVLNMSLTASMVILVVMAARFLLKRSPRIFSYALWSVVLFRLLCPVSFSAPVSILEILQPQVQEALEVTSVVTYLPSAVHQTSDFHFVPTDMQTADGGQAESEIVPPDLDILAVVSRVWAAGAFMLILCSAFQYIRLRLQLIGATVYRGNVFLADHIDSPFVMGVLQPRVYLPSDVPKKERLFIIAHERHHIRRCDHVIKLLAYFALCIHWFNPLVWAAFILAGKDMEMSCDEAVIKRLGSQIRADYSASLLRLATHKKIIAGMPLAFGEGDTKGRVLNMAKWKKPRLWVSIVCFALCAAVLVACAVNPDNTESTTTVETQVLAETKKITLENDPLPEGYFEDLDENGNIIFSDETNTVGGIICYAIPEGIYNPEDGVFHWLEEMGIPDYEDPNLIYLGGITSGDKGWAAEFTDDPDNEANRTVYRRHTFQVVEDRVYDIWFDLLKISFDDAYEIRRALNIPQPLAETETYMPSVPGSDIVTDTELIQYGSLKMLLGPGFVSREQDGNVVLTKDSVDVGGIRHWNYPEFQPSDIVELKKEESRAPIGYMSSSSAYGDMEYEIFWDGNPDALNEKHTFFTDGDSIYDVWYDKNEISAGIAERFLKTVAINAEPVIEENPDKQAAFAKCRAVMEAVQNGSYKIVSRQINAGNEGPRGYERIYCRNNEDWLSVTNVLTEGENFADGMEYTVTKSALCANGRRFSYTGTEWVEIANDENSLLPWLADFTWDENVVAYMDTLSDEEGECVWLRVDKQYIDSDAYDPHYFLYFNFDGNGNFVDVELQVNLFRENELSITESIVTLDPETAAAEIAAEYQQAVAKSN